jgi:two-component system nitrate/nitrite sensor histidine kinase NarX
MSGTTPLSTKLSRIGSGLLLALVSIGLTLWVTWQIEGGAAAVNEAGRMSMQTWRLTSAVQAQLPLDQIAMIVAEFDNSLTLLRHGDASRPLFVPWDDGVRREFAQVQALWRAERNQWLRAGGLDALNAQRLASDFVTACEPFLRGAMAKILVSRIT